MEIQTSLNFSPEQVSMLNMHSVLNVLNVINYELLKLSDHLEDDQSIMPLMGKVQGLAEDLKDPDKTYQHLSALDRFAAEIMDSLDRASLKSEADQTYLEACKNNLAGILKIMEVRAKEISDRWDNPLEWREFDPEQLKANFREVFAAIEKNSHGAYHIVCNLAHQDSGDYFISLEVGKDENTDYKMPLVFQDIMRDLMANARKYTPPGGRIVAGLYISEKELTFVVEDSGQGIPRDELEEVVRFGSRGSNSKDRPTRGGGFGLTKAYYVCKTLGGKMFIDSPIMENKGTRVKIILPTQ